MSHEYFVQVYFLLGCVFLQSRDFARQLFEIELVLIVVPKMAA